MTRLAVHARRRLAFTLIELLVVIGIITVLIGLIIPAVQQVRMSALRTQTTNNLHQCSLAAIAFHDANGWLPYNGTTANPGIGVTDSGSWAYQILPFIEQQNIFTSQTSTTLPSSWGTPIVTLLDPMRPRPGYLSGSIDLSVNPVISGIPTTVAAGTSQTITVPAGTLYTLVIPPSGAPMTITVASTPNPTGGASLTIISGNITIKVYGGFSGSLSSGSGGVTITPSTPPTTDQFIVINATGSPAGTPSAGPVTDFGINPFINVSSGGTVGAANNHRNTSQILDGTSNTILLGEMYCAIADYPVTAPTFTKLPIFDGGTLNTTRNGILTDGTTWLQDGVATTSNQWGSPMSYGGLMAMADGSVHLIPYTTPLTSLLEPNDGVAVTIP